MPLNKEQMRVYQRERRAGLARGSEVRSVSGDKSPAVVESEERANEVPVNPQIPPPIESQHTKTDQLFEQKKPGYWIFEKEVLRKPCWYCGEEFETRLRLNKFCSPDHKERWLIASLRMGKE